ncbi:MAG: ATP-binding cassette domain-containing protein [Chloroflexia bacterium]|nr:ATP-binding cassette domain-containing protein [Chloroflexia bacterium]
MALDIQGVTKRFGALTAVDDVSFRVEPGRIFGFLGTNGAGKTTTMRMVLDILRPDSGTITWDGAPNTTVSRQAFGYLPEERGLYPKMTVAEQLRFLARLYGASKAAVERALDAWFDHFDIAENRGKRVEQLSKGNQQKVQFLAAILHDPEILILDEPFSGLDPVNAAQMKVAFLELRDRGKTIIYSTHQLDQAQEMCEDVAIIHRGRIVAGGDIRTVRRSMGTRVVRFAVADDPLPHWVEAVPGARLGERRDDHVELLVPDEEVAQRVLRAGIDRGATVTRFEIADPSLYDVFLASVGRHPELADAATTRTPEPIAV